MKIRPRPDSRSVPDGPAEERSAPRGPSFLSFAVSVDAWPFGQGLVPVNSMTADLVDYDESLNGRRREAPIAAANGRIAQTGVSLSCGLAGLVLTTTGFDAALGDNQPPGTVLWIRILFCALPALGTGTALLLLHGYPRTRKRLPGILAKLAQASR
jgi:Na+/melibiose symporter-like transporter